MNRKSYQDEYLNKNYGKRQDAIITDCFVVMPEGVTDTEGNRRYCKIENAAWDTGATNMIISPEIVKVLNLQPLGKRKYRRMEAL